jgi:hypothetical protein
MAFPLRLDLPKYLSRAFAFFASEMPDELTTLRLPTRTHTHTRQPNKPTTQSK